MPSTMHSHSARRAVAQAFTAFAQCHPDYVALEVA
jgi:hypothetical protein